MPEDAATLIYGINHGTFDPSRHCIVSAASCTTTALAHMMLPMLEHELTRHMLKIATLFTQSNQYRVIMEVDPQFAGDPDSLRRLFITTVHTSAFRAV